MGVLDAVDAAALAERIVARLTIEIEASSSSASRASIHPRKAMRGWSLNTSTFPFK